MEKRRSALRFGSPVRFRDRWQGRLVALEVSDHWAAENVVVSKGFPWPGALRLPFRLARLWTDDRLEMDCTADEAFGRRLPPQPVAAHRIDRNTARGAAQVRIVGVLIHRQERRLTHLLLEQGRLNPQTYAFPVERAVFLQGGIGLTGQLAGLPIYRSDEDLAQAVRQALAAHPSLTGDDRRGLSLQAIDGIVFLRGNVRTSQARTWAEQAAQAVPGVLEVRNELWDDTNLEIAVGQAFAAASLFRQARLFVHAVRGDIVLEGFAPSQGIVDQARAVAAELPGVRNVVARVEVTAGP